MHGLKETMLTLSPIQMKKLNLCLQMWQLIRLYTIASPDPTLITAKPLKKRLRDLEQQVAIQLPPPGSSEKRPRSGDDTTEGNRPPPPPPALRGPTRVDIMRSLTLSQEERNQFYTRYNPTFTS